MNKLTNYKVTFTGTKGEVSLMVESPLQIDCEHEENVHSIIDVTIDLAEHLLGADFRENLDVFAISLDFADEDSDLVESEYEEEESE